MKMILSTLSQPNELVFTQDNPNGSKRIVKRILIKGGANVVDRKTMVTPAGVITELNDKDYELVINSPWFKRQEKAGFVRPVEDASSADNPKKKGMKSKDKSSQKTEKDYEKDGLKVHTGKPSDDKE